MKYKSKVAIACAIAMAVVLAEAVALYAAYDPLKTGFPSSSSQPEAVKSSSSPASSTYKTPPMTASGALLPYDPFMDNHFIAPPSPQGLFGLHVKEAERILKSYGAKSYSYAFGKHSRLQLSVYLITLFFDRNRKIAEIQVEPKPPYKTIEPTARSFFMQLLTKGTQPSEFSTVFSPSKISVKYMPPTPKR